MSRRIGRWSWVLIGLIGIMLMAGGSWARTPQEAAAAAEHHGPHLTILHYLGRAINFGLLVWILYYLLFKMGRIQDIFARQRAEIEREIQEARHRKDNAEARWAAIQANLSRLNEEIETLRAQAKSEAEAERERILAEARAEVDRLKKLAEEEIERTARFATREIRAYAADLAVQVSRRLLSERLTPADHEALIRASLEHFKMHKGHESR